MNVRFVKIFPALCCALFAAWCVSADEVLLKETGMKHHPLTSLAVKELAEGLKNARVLYFSELNNARRISAASSAANCAAEVERIDRALGGAFGVTFATPSARAAYKGYHGKLTDLARLVLVRLRVAVREARTAGEFANASYLDARIAELDRLLDIGSDAPSSGRRMFRVSAKGDWQATGVELKRGAEVTFSVTGNWAPGVRRKRGVSSANADVYPVAFRIGARVGKFGRNGRFTVGKDEGELFFRMAGPAFNPRFLSEARGDVNVYVNWLAPVSGVEVTSLDRALSAMVESEGVREVRDPAGNAVPAAGKDAIRMKLAAAGMWQSAGVTVKAGQKIGVKADGVWTYSDKPGVLFRDADQLKYAVRIGGAGHGRGGREFSFFARKNGLLEFSPGFASWAKNQGFQPAGTLELEITVSGK